METTEEHRQFFDALAGSDYSMVMKYLKREDGKSWANQRDSEGAPALFRAFKTGYIDTLKLLLEAGADVNVKHRNGETLLLHIFLEANNHIHKERVLKNLLLTHGADVTVVDGQQRTLLHILLAEGHVGRIACLHETVTFPSSRDDTCISREEKRRRRDEMHIAQRIHRLKLFSGKRIVTTLLDRLRAHVDAIDEKGETPLQLAIQHRELEYARLLLEHGANVNAKSGFNGFSPLHSAVYQQSSTSMVQLLLNYQADVNAQTTEFGDTALHLAVRRGTTGLAQLLVTSGADIAFKNFIGVSPLREEVERSEVENSGGNILKCFLSQKDDSQSKFFHSLIEQNTDAVREHLSQDATLAMSSLEGSPALVLACKYRSKESDKADGYLDMIRLLLRNEADVNSRSESGSTALHKACSRLDLELITLLLDHKADIAAQDDSGDTPLHKVVKYLFHDMKTNDSSSEDDTLRSARECAAILLARGANINVENSKHVTPLDLACEKGELDIIYSMIRFSPHHLRPQLCNRTLSLKRPLELDEKKRTAETLK